MELCVTAVFINDFHIGKHRMACSFFDFGGTPVSNVPYPISREFALKGLLLVIHPKQNILIVIAESFPVQGEPANMPGILFDRQAKRPLIALHRDIG